jgi:hypothetical protein
MTEKGRAHQKGRPRNDGKPVARQLLPQESSLLTSIQDMINGHKAKLAELDPTTQTAEHKKVGEQLGFLLAQLRARQRQFGQPVDSE